jgi:hypothetical protein
MKRSGGMSPYVGWQLSEPDTILRASLRKSMRHGLKARDEEIRLLVTTGGHGIRATARRFAMTPQNVVRIRRLAGSRERLPDGRVRLETLHEGEPMLGYCLRCHRLRELAFIEAWLSSTSGEMVPAGVCRSCENQN